jgi:hypothetical protein
MDIFEPSVLALYHNYMNTISGAWMFTHFITAVLLIILTGSLTFGYDEYTDSMPNWEERTVLVLTNACRMAPVAYRDRHIGGSSILLPENYPAVPPLYRGRALSESARSYSLRMATECGLTHTCNGESFQSRLESFYGSGGYIGENIASGYRTPQQVVAGWIIDGQSADEAAADKSGSDGHRSNIMNRRFRETGCGYMFTGSGHSAKPYWCQDFGSKPNPYSYHPVPAATHVFFTNGEIAFLANVYDTTESLSSVSLLLENNRFPMTPDMGTEFAGTYTVSRPEASACRHYRIEVTRNDGSLIYYPETGSLPTTGEGSCTEVATTYAVGHSAGDILSHTASLITVKKASSGFRFAISSRLKKTVRTSLFTCSGILLHAVEWTGQSRIINYTDVPNAVFVVRHVLSDGTIRNERIFSLGNR